jgi:formylglycine-generating enzyme required for sulfatase activity
MVLVEPGSFQMGAADGYHDAQPVHTVCISTAFYIGIYEVTFDEYDRFCEDTVRAGPDDRGWGRGRMPVLHVNWYDVAAYCNWLSEKTGLPPCYSGAGRNTRCDFAANGYRLPTEAEWEYAARGGPRSQGHVWAGSNNPDEVAWYDQTDGNQPHPVGTKAPNELGLYDMSGNMFEWCWDWYDAEYYASSPAVDPHGPAELAVTRPWDLNRVRRSGSWREDAESIRVTTRSADIATYVGDNGFRLVRTA